MSYLNLIWSDQIRSYPITLVSTRLVATDHVKSNPSTADLFATSLVCLTLSNPFQSRHVGLIRSKPVASHRNSCHQVVSGPVGLIASSRFKSDQNRSHLVLSRRITLVLSRRGASRPNPSCLSHRFMALHFPTGRIMLVSSYRFRSKLIGSYPVGLVRSHPNES